jgi:hypothetical protein
MPPLIMFLFMFLLLLCGVFIGYGFAKSWPKKLWVAMRPRPSAHTPKTKVDGIKKKSVRRRPLARRQRTEPD